MTKLEFIEVKGLTGRKETLHVEFDDKMNVIWGSNGSGKTSILKIIHSAMTGDPAPILRVSFSSARVGFIDNRGRNVIRSINRKVPDSRITMDLDDGQDFDGYRDLELTRYEIYKDAQALRWSSSETTDDLGYVRHRYLPISRVFDFRNRQGRPSRGGGGISEVLDEVEYDRVFAEQIQSLWSEYHSLALSHTRWSQQDAVNRILGAVLAGDEYSDIVREDPLPTDDAQRLVANFFETHKGLSRHVNVEKVISDYKTNPLMNRVVRTVSEVQQQIEDAQAPERRFEEVINDLYGGKKIIDVSGPRRLRVSLAEGGSPIPIESLASGEKQVMRILLETLVAGSSPVVLDEPEISLHVDWQGKLLELMRYINPEAQIIAASHSPEVVGGIVGTGLLIEA